MKSDIKLFTYELIPRLKIYLEFRMILGKRKEISPIATNECSQIIPIKLIYYAFHRPRNPVFR